MSTTLAEVLTALGTPQKPRYSIEEVAEILGIRREQVNNLLRKGRMVGARSSANRWRWVFARDLDDYIQKVNAPRQVRKRIHKDTGIVGASSFRSTQAEAPRPGITLPVPIIGDSEPPDFPLSPDAGLPIHAPDAPHRSGRRDLDL